MVIEDIGRFVRLFPQEVGRSVLILATLLWSLARTIVSRDGGLIAGVALMSVCVAHDLWRDWDEALRPRVVFGPLGITRRDR